MFATVSWVRVMPVVAVPAVHRQQVSCTYSNDGNSNGNGAKPTRPRTRPYKVRPTNLPKPTFGPDEEHGHIKQVQVVFRHGARTPLTAKYWEGHEWEDGEVCGQAYEPVLLDITNVEDGGPTPVSTHDQEQRATKLPGGCHKGQLTLTGQAQALEFGQWLRTRYIDQLHLLPSEYEHGTVLGRTSNFQRTIATLEGVLTGMYETTPTPVPVKTAGDGRDWIYPNVKNCRRLQTIIQNAFLTIKQNYDLDPRTQELERQVRRFMQIPDDETLAFTDLFDALTTLHTHGKKLPDGLEHFIEDIETEALARLESMVAAKGHDGTPNEALQLSLGPLLQDFIDRMEDCIEGTSTAKMHLYSGHDTTVMPLLIALDVHLSHWPTYVSNIVLELWEKDNGSPRPDYYVHVLYNHNEIELPQSHGSEDGCKFETFKKEVFGPYAIPKSHHTYLCNLCTEEEMNTPALAGGGASIQGV